jgi:hypothetical protein
VTASELQRANIDRFERLLVSEKDPEQRVALDRVLGEERRKGASDYPGAGPARR